MVKTKVEILESMHDEALQKVLFTQAEIDLCQGKILLLITPDSEAERAVREQRLEDLKRLKGAHEQMLEKIAQMLEEALKEEKKSNEIQRSGEHTTV